MRFSLYQRTYAFNISTNSAILVDRLRTQLHDPEGLRENLLEIHSMAHAILNGAPSVPSRHEGTWPEQVLDALDLIDDFIANLTQVRTFLEPLEALSPDDGCGDV